MASAPEREIGTELTAAMHDSTGGYELVVGALAASGVGFAVDRIFGLVPLFTMLFAFAGFVGAGYSLWLNYRQKMAVASADRRARVDGERGLPT